MIHPVYSIIINHNFDKVGHFEFITKNIQNFLKLSKLYISFNVFCTSSDQKNKDKKVIELKEYIKQKCGLDINLIKDEEEKNNTINKSIDKKYKVINFNSDMLLSYFFFHNLNSFFYDFNKNISLPVMHYKYIYKDFTYKNKVFTIKKFVLSKEQYYQGSDDFAEWDERLYIDHRIFSKMNGKLPIACPSPLLHNWGFYLPLVTCEKGEESIKICDSKFSIHRFEVI